MLSSGYSQDASTNATLVAMTGKPVKQGWVYKKSSFIRGWTPKYLVLFPSCATQGPCLMIYDQCDQSKPPRYTIPLLGCQLELKNQYKLVFKFPIFRKKLFSLFVITSGPKQVIYYRFYSKVYISIKHAC